jgi:hypothetical protein
MKRKIALLAVAATVLGGCGSAASNGSGDSGGPAQPEIAEIGVSRVRDHNSFAELTTDSTAVVRVSAGEAQEDTLNGVAVTVTTVAVTQTISGHLPSTTLSIQQLGSTTVSSPDTSQLLRRGREYLLFVTPFQLAAKNTERYVITGDQGIYLLERGESALPTPAQFVFVGAGEPGLPRSLPVADVNSRRFLR